MAQYFEERPEVPSQPARVAVPVAGRRLDLVTDRGVFARRELDRGTAVLFRKAPPPPATGCLLDLGCGYGPIALWLAAQSPAAEVWAVDVNERALALAAENAAGNDLTNVTVATPDAVPATLRFDAVYSNPPIRVGKAALREMLTSWIDRLAPEGAAYFVVQRHLGADSLQAWLNAQEYVAQRLGSSKGYRVLRVSR